jgi:hypothetical protein
MLISCVFKNIKNCMKFCVICSFTLMKMGIYSIFHFCTITQYVDGILVNS